MQIIRILLFSITVFAAFLLLPIRHDGFMQFQHDVGAGGMLLVFILALAFHIAVTFIPSLSKKLSSHLNTTPDSNENPVNRPGHRLIGKTVHVDTITGQGRGGTARVGDSVWKIEGNGLSSGMKVTVVRIRGNRLVVEAPD